MIETVRDIALDNPGCISPGMLDFLERGVASSSFPKSMRMRAELNVVIGVQDQPDHFCQKLVAPDGQAKRTLFPIPLCNVGSSCWLPLIPFQAQCANDVLYFFKGHGIHGFFSDPFRH